tara:strand:+ start:491 stop:700 length:210 start_codon:yes stop_codon:yes gene_type:complete
MEKETKLNKEQNEIETKLLAPFGGRKGVRKKSLRPTQSLKPISIFPRKIKSVPRIQKIDHPLESDSSVN